ncbi:hypothetical protein PSMK_14790 [Phycisphaera mikurensis NBRC 102666]|uniref:Uncharacterized protein n=1 Tax=Phycisphaera mikurensis (strain NBRC 102666 / KCTC 22515 / FYK2301M01) TaxID=1142394 RepID=I0IEF0_PHYMF|nr:hypothetical protein PSMK_14790 [Phycisphaera mikurensis NBRC 102666]
MEVPVGDRCGRWVGFGLPGVVRSVKKEAQRCGRGSGPARRRTSNRTRARTGCK